MPDPTGQQFQRLLDELEGPLTDLERQRLEELQRQRRALASLLKDQGGEQPEDLVKLLADLDARIDRLSTTRGWGDPAPALMTATASMTDPSQTEDVVSLKAELEQAKAELALSRRSSRIAETSRRLEISTERATSMVDQVLSRLGDEDFQTFLDTTEQLARLKRQPAAKAATKPQTSQALRQAVADFFADED